jgi:hypothetical protein
MTSETSTAGSWSIALIPLDERPVNTRLPSDIGAVAGIGVSLPGSGCLPQQRTPGRPEALARWLASESAGTNASIVFADTLAYGGLIASRTTADDSATAFSRLEILSDIRKGRNAPILFGVSLVMRASDTYDPGEEPEYWRHYGRDLHSLGGRYHQHFLAADEDREIERTKVRAIEAHIPADVRADFMVRRLRNHQVNLHMLEMLSRDVLDYLFVTADDTAEYSAGSLEQLWVARWAESLPAGARMFMYPGADEVASALVARCASAFAGTTVSMRVECADPVALDRVARYENRPLSSAVGAQLAVAHVRLVEDPRAQADVCLVIHGPDPLGRDWAMAPVEPGPDDVAAAEDTVRLVNRLLAEGRRVALADVRYANGSDPLVVEALARTASLLRLHAYGGWNTAGNTLGSVVAAAAVSSIGDLTGRKDPSAAQRVLLHRIIEDYLYQAKIRPVIQRELVLTGGDVLTPADEEKAAADVAQRLTAALAELLGPSAWQISNVRFPWHRTFEVDFDLEAGVAG